MGIYNLTGGTLAVLGPAPLGYYPPDPRPPEQSPPRLQYRITTLVVMVVVGLVIHLGTPNIRRVRA